MVEMERNEILDKIKWKKEFSQLPEKDVLMAFEKFDNDNYSDEEKVKFTRDLLRKVFSGFSGKKLLGLKNKSADEILIKHLSTRERYAHYSEIYGRILSNMPKKLSIIDLGSGVNGFSYNYFNQLGKKVDYLGVEAIGQIVQIVNDYFDKEKISGKMLHLSLFETAKIKELIKSSSKPRVIFLFKVIDSLEKFERNYTKKLLQEIVPVSDKIVISFATESWMKRKKFYANRKWLLDFIKDNWQITDDFEFGGERYIIFINK
jgi:Ribosomal RNA methyltransferase (FmrO)